MAESTTRVKEILALNVKLLRKKKGLSQENLAEMADLSTQSISDIEGRRTWVSDKTLERLAKVFEVDVYNLFMPVSVNNDNSELLFYDQLKKLRSIMKEDIDKRLDQFYLSAK